MKKKIALLVIMILTLSLALAACNSVAATTKLTRWDRNGEKHVFNISLADFVEGDYQKNSFNYYYADGQLTTPTGTNNESIYSKDIAFTGEFNNWDEIRPVAVNGSYTIEIVPSSDGTEYCDVTTTQEICAQYYLKDIDENSKILSAKATAAQLAKYGMTDSVANTVTLWSSTETKVRFKNLPVQTPQSSWVKVDGFYVGKVAQELTKYEISTAYDYAGKRPVATTTFTTEEGTDTIEYKFGKSTEGNFIDSNQILLYLRSLDKSSTSFQDKPSIYVFNPYTQTLQTASFGMSYEYNLLLTDTSENKLFATKLNLVSVTVGNNAFMMQENLPDKLADKNLDVCTIDTKESKFTTVRFRVGYLAYEIDYANSANTSNWNNILTALSSTT